MLLMAEMGLFMLLLVPLPFAVKRKLFTYVPPFVDRFSTADPYEAFRTDN